ncbi:hypothetical protein [Spirosoma terrae]|nr:hypothetical protein [Spirosoma terrae]
MKNKARSTSPFLLKKQYKTPSFKLLGSVKKLTLKVGSGGDGFGTFTS